MKNLLNSPGFMSFKRWEHKTDLLPCLLCCLPFPLLRSLISRV